MSSGVARILPCAAISAVLHAAVLMNVPERVEIAATPGDHASAVAVRLVPSRATPSDAAAQSGVAGSRPAPSHERNEQPDSAPGDREEKTPAAESYRPSEQGGTGPDPLQAAPDDRTTTETAPNDTDRKRAETVASEKNEPARESGTTPDMAAESNQVASTPKTGTSDTPDAPKASAASEANGPREPARPDKASEGDMQAEKQSDAEGTDDRAQLASHARQQVQIHFRDRFRYPRIARQRGWEGRVVLAFRLQPDGRITDVEVTESSGRRLLDEDARETLLGIKRVPDVARQLADQPLELEVPVAYRLVPANTHRVAGAR